MKTCTKCKSDLQLSDFYPHKLTKDGFRPVCKVCGRTDALNYYGAVGEARRLDRTRFIDLMKVGVGCLDCGTRAGTLDFHHREVGSKEFCVSQRPHAPWSILMDEIFKCDVLCRSCHTTRHWA